MRPGIIIALIACSAMVSWAAWYRLASRPPALALVPIETPKQSQAYYDELISKVLATASTTSVTKPGPLTATDLVGRQLITDYVSLAQSGQATDENIEALATKYADSIPSIAAAKQANYLDLHIVPNDSGNFSSYAIQIETIYHDYATRLLEVYPAGGIALDTRATKASETMSNIYTDTVKKLEALPVPAALASAHLALLNIYLSDAAGTDALANHDADPAGAFASLLAYKNNAGKEAEILSQIQEALAKHGI